MESASVHLAPRFDLADDEVELRSGVSWEQFVRFCRTKRNGQRVTYLDGQLEVTSPGARHESVKSIIGHVFERYVYELRIRTRATGSWLQRVKARGIGIEPDESYVFTPGRRTRCDLAIEVIATSGSTRKLEVYRRLRVPEVWFWIRGRITIYRLGPLGYAEVARSQFVPALDPRLLERLLRHEWLADAVDELLAALGRTA